MLTIIAAIICALFIIPVALEAFGWIIVILAWCIAALVTLPATIRDWLAGRKP